MVGNNARAAQVLGLEDIRPFAEVGVQGVIKPAPFEQLLVAVQLLYRNDPLVFPYGPDNVSRIGICSGAAQRDLERAIDEGLDVFITGEVSEPVMHKAREGHIHFIGAGHYDTEKLGIIALGEHIANTFDVGIEFIDIPNPV